jgi:translation initiation factor 5B
LNEDEDVEEELLKEIEDITINTEDEGILVKADTLGSLEAIVKLLRELEIPIREAGIGDVNRRDIINSSIALNENDAHGAIIAFNVSVHPNSVEDLNNSDVKLFEGDVIYQIIEDYEEWIDEMEKAKKKAFYNAIIKPAKFMALPKLVFRQSKPAIVGIESISGTIKQGQTLINKNGEYVGVIASMEDKGETLPDISRGQRVAMAIKDAIVGKSFDEGDELYVDVPEKHYKFIEREFKDKLTEDEFETLYEFVEIKRKKDPDWGKFGLFE